VSAALESLLNRRQLWRGRQPGCKDAGSAVATGFAALDGRLPAEGWPRGALTEIVLPASGIGELRLLLPALRQLQREGRWIALVAPPNLPYAPAWRNQGIDLSRLLWVRAAGNDGFWAVEQALRSGVCGAVLAWPVETPAFQRLRRLQLAAEAGDCLGILFVSPERAGQPTPAALRLRLEAGPHGLEAWILKARGGGVADTGVRIDDPPLTLFNA
jgi:hypothetical protein